MKKPWEQGYIPKPGKKPKFTGPATPKGWHRVERGDCVQFDTKGASLWTFDRIIGVVGKPWKLWLNHNIATFRQPDMQMGSLNALLVWYEVEQANREPEMYNLPTDATVTFALNYGMSAPRLRSQLMAYQQFAGVKEDAGYVNALTYRLPIVRDFTKLEERIALWKEMGTEQPSKAGTGSPESNSTSGAPCGETVFSGPPTSPKTSGTEGG